MNVTRDVVTDLLPAYLAGEASADTRALVDEFLKQDASLARLVQSARMERSEAMSEAARLSPPPNAEREIVARTRAVIRRRTWTQAVAIVFTLLPFSVVFQDRGITFFVLRDAPWQSAVSWALALTLWMWVIVDRRRLRGSGL